MTLRTLVLLTAGLLASLPSPSPAQSAEPELESALVASYGRWRDAMVRQDARAWAGAITQYRQVVTRNQLVSEKQAFPDEVFANGDPPKLDGLRLLESEAVGKTAHLVYFGKVDLGQDRNLLKDTVLKLKFGFENGGWKYDSNRFTSFDTAPEVLKALQSGKKADFLDTPEFTPPGTLPAVPPLCRVPEFKGGYKLQSFGYETQVLMNGFDYTPVEDALDQQVIIGGLVTGQNEITLRMTPVPTPENGKSAVQIRLYKLDVTQPDKPGIEVLRWEAPDGKAPKQITLPFTVK
ncbi:MAG: hypothetical protein IPK22_03035 [Verrucomicrobiaceae bacterium]|nr:hypothetical protein [Verrucomicrobiaceae bacterium]